MESKKQWFGHAWIVALVAVLVWIGNEAHAATQLGPVQRQGSLLRLEWTGATGPVQLQEAASPDGPWLDLGAPMETNSILLTPNFERRFFRTASTGSTNDPEASMRATLKAVGDFVATVPRSDPVAWRTRVLEFLQARPDIDSAGEHRDGIWAITQDGVPLTLWNNRNVDTEALTEPERAVAPAGTETPGKTPARFSVTVGAGFAQSAPRLASLLRGNGYQTVSDDGSVNALKGVHNESIFFLNTHGGAVFMPLFGADGKPSRNGIGKILYAPNYGLWTGTKIDPVKTDIGYKHEEFVAELKAKRMAVALAPASYTTGTGGVQSPNNEWHFCVTADWVKKYVSFPAQNHASVWLAVCRSGSADAAPLRAAFRAVGAEMVSGWTEDVNAKSVLAATPFVFDRLLGANQVLPPATPQRPFDYENVWTELRSKGLHRHATTDPQGRPATTDLIYEGVAGDDKFGLFAPSIEYVLVDEGNDQLNLIGLFGNPPTEDQKVTIGGSEAAIASWEPRKIVCKLERKGAGSVGDVQVIARGRKSNIRQLSRWTIVGTYLAKEKNTAHEIDGRVTLIFRADVGEYRKVPGNVFIRPTRSALAGRDSEVFLEAKGIDSSPCGNGGQDREIWSGSGNWLVRGFNDDVVHPFHSIVFLSVNTIDLTGSLGLGFGIVDADASPLKMTFESCEGPSITLAMAPPVPGSFDDPPMFKMPLEEVLPDGSAFEIPLPGERFSVNADFSIPAGTMSNPLNASLKWNAAGIESPPDKSAAR